MHFGDQVLRKHKDNLAKFEYFNDFFLNISENLTRQLYPLDSSSLNTFITRIKTTKDNIEFHWELVKDKGRPLTPKRTLALIMYPREISP